LDAWRHGRVSLIISPDILDEYHRTGDKLAKKYPGVDLEPWIELLMLKASFVDAPSLSEILRYRERFPQKATFSGGLGNYLFMGKGIRRVGV